MDLKLEALEINSIPFPVSQQNAFYFCKRNLTAHKLYIHSYVVLILSGNHRQSCAVTPQGGMRHVASPKRFLAICDVPLNCPTFRYRFTIV